MLKMKHIPYPMQKSAGCKVILVDDNKAEADLTQIIYREQGIPVQIVHCLNGEEFLNMLTDTEKEEICYVLLDLNMPRLNGYEVLQALAKDKQWSNLMVIIFSSSSNEIDISKCYEMGANAYVVKPIDLNELDRTIHAIHGFWGNTNIKPNQN